MKKSFFIGFIVVIFLLHPSFTFAQNGKVHYTSTKTVNPVPEGKQVEYTYKVFKNNDGSFGYAILANGKTYFYQANYPGRTEGFTEKRACEAVASLVIKKINSGKMIPAVNNRELHAYGINN